MRTQKKLKTKRNICENSHRKKRTKAWGFLLNEKKHQHFPCVCRSILLHAFFRSHKFQHFFIAVVKMKKSEANKFRKRCLSYGIFVSYIYFYVCISLLYMFIRIKRLTSIHCVRCIKLKVFLAK